MDKTLDTFLSNKRKAKDPEEVTSSQITTSKNIPKETEEKAVTPVKEVSEIKLDPKKDILASFDDFINSLGSWKDPLKDYTSKATMKFTYDYIKDEYAKKTIYPPKNLIFNTFIKVPWDKIKVIIIGQDPYPNQGEAMGMSFSVPKGIKTPKSLVNIYKCLMNDKVIAMKSMPSHGDLSAWADQGVFLLNATLTVEAKKINSHQKTSKWSLFTDHVIQTISKGKEHIVFLLWGNFAIQKKKFIDSSKHLIIETIHPSPLAQTKGDFTASDQFSKANEYLKKNKIEEINWTIK